jgi:hypothetical protein
MEVLLKYCSFCQWVPSHIDVKIFSEVDDLRRLNLINQCNLRGKQEVEEFSNSCGTIPWTN